MQIYYDPDEYKTVHEHQTCSFHLLNPSEQFAGCTCSCGTSSVRRSLEEIAAIKAERRRMEEDRILAEAEIIKASRAAALRAQAAEMAGLRKKLGKLHDYANMRDVQIVDAEAKLASAMEALTEIKERVTGDRHPRWGDDYAVTGSRMSIADICDTTLSNLKGEAE